MSYLKRHQDSFLVHFLIIIAFTSMPNLSGDISAWALQTNSSAGLLITEFDYNPPGLDEEREWVELANVSDQPIHLTGYGLGDEEQIGGGEGMLRFPEGSKIGPGDVIVVARTAVGFRALFGINPDFEVQDTDSAIPDMLVDSHWASGLVAFANDGDEIILMDDQNNMIDALSYGDSIEYFSPSLPLIVSGQSVERVPAICDTNSAVDWRPQNVPTPGKVILDGPCATSLQTERETQLPAIGVIQGTGDVSPFLNQVVTFRGLVTGIQEDQNASGVVFYTIFVQDIPGFEDGDAQTSDAVPVFLGRKQPRYQIGDQVLVTGQVTEYFGLTEIDDNGLSIQVESSSETLPDAKVIDLPQDLQEVISYLESLEGMYVQTNDWLPVWGPTHSGCGFAVGSMPDSARPLRQSAAEIVPPPILVLNQSDVDCTLLPDVKSGDFVDGIAGPLTYNFEQYKVVQQDATSLQVKQGEPISLPPLLPKSQHWFRVATLNLDNYLSPSLDKYDRQLGHPSPSEFKIKQHKLTYTISLTLACPELLGVQEVQSKALLSELAALTADACGFLYDVTHLESADGRGIDVALLSDPRHVFVEHAELHQTCSTLVTGVRDGSIECAPGEEPLFSRPPLEINVRINDEPMTIFVNHFKSKSGGELETASRRQAQAQHVHELVKNHLAGDPQAGVIVLGDFNDFNLSAVWQKLQEGGALYDTMRFIPSQGRYSYIFDGESQLIDGILISPALVHRVAEAAILHINADYPLKFAFDDSNAALLYRASDHDPLIVTIDQPSQEVSVRETATQIEVPPTATLLPTIQLLQKVKEMPTIQPMDPTQRQEKDGTGLYLGIAGLAVLLAVTAVWWLTRQAPK